MTFRPFALERLFARWEFTARHLLSSSDCETMSVGELLDLAGVPRAALADVSLGYTDSQGDPPLRAAIAASLGVGPDDVVVCAPAEGIALACAALLEPGDRVVVQAPCFQSLDELPRHLGCTVERWPVAETDGGWRLDLDRLDALLAPGTKLLVILAPQMPTGQQPTRAEADALFALAAARGVWVFCDEMYRGLEPDASRRLPAAASRGGRVVALGGLSKTYGLPGLRVGWLASRDRGAVEAILRAKDYSTICAPGVDQFLARAAFNVADRLAARSRAIVDENLARARAFVARHADRFAWREPGAGSVAFIRLLGGGAEAFCERAVNEAGVMVVPSTVFDFGDAHIRLGLGRKGFPDALSCLEAWLRPR